MPSVYDFKKYLEKTPYEAIREHRVIYNYLKHFCAEDQALSIPLFKDFYRKALLFPHWQSHRALLSKKLTKELKHFSQFYHSLNFDPEELNSQVKWQLISLQNEQDMLKMARTYLQNKAESASAFRVLLLDKYKALGLCLSKTGDLNVSTFGPLAIIEQGQLEPLSTLCKLYYSPDYELKTEPHQVVEDGHSNFIRFKARGHMVEGVYVQGFCFQEFERIRPQHISKIPALFYPLKQLESLFIQANSDPHYKQLIQDLHKHYRQILLSPLDISAETKQVALKAKTALKKLYPQDRLLFLLVSNIDFYLSKLDYNHQALKPPPLPKEKPLNEKSPNPTSSS